MLFISFLLVKFCLAKTIVLSPEMSSTVPLEKNQTVSIAKNNVVKLRDSGGSLKITGKKIGQVELTIAKEVWHVWVVRAPIYRTYKKLQLWSQGKRGPEIAIENYRLQIRGRFLTFEDWNDLVQFTDEDDDFLIKAKIDGEIQKLIENRLKSLLEKNNLAYSYFATEPSWTLTLGKTAAEELKNYKRILSSYGVQLKDSPLAIKSMPLIEVSIVAAEVQRSEMSRFGIQWPASTAFQALPQFNSPPASILATIHHLEEVGKGRVLAKPTLVSQSGEEATFHSGGEFPIKAMNQFQSSVVWKKYGLILKIKPQADRRGKMDLKIDCEFSTLDTREDDAGVPGLIVHRVTSHLNLEESKTMVLSGLIKDEWRNTKTGLPGLLKIPILSPLFSSESYQNNQSELIFFVTPRVLQ
jgi:pilus assembly protein CpaC